MRTNEKYSRNLFHKFLDVHLEKEWGTLVRGKPNVIVQFCSIDDQSSNLKYHYRHLLFTKYEN
jgi:hypothetical protein